MTPMKRMQLLAIFAVALALLGYSGIRVIQASAAAQKQTAETTEEPSRDQSGSGGVQTGLGGPLGSGAGQPTAKTSVGTPGSSKGRGGSGAGRSSVGAGSLRPTLCNEAHRKGHVEDAERDGDLGMVLHFEASQSGIDPGDTEARLTGRTAGALPSTGPTSSGRPGNATHVRSLFC